MVISSWTKCILLLFNVTVFAATLFSSNAQGSSVVHAVGGHLGWTVLAGRGFYQNWVDSRSIFVGDILYFGYDRTRHSVLQVEEQDYNSCTISEPLLLMWSGHDGVRLLDSAQYFFVSGTPGDCEAGLKFFIRPLLRRRQQGRDRSSSRGLASLRIEARIGMRAQPATPPLHSMNPPTGPMQSPKLGAVPYVDGVALMVVGGLIIVVGIAVVALILNARTHNIVTKLKASSAETSANTGSPDDRLERHYKLTSCRLYTLKELEAATDNFCEALLLGQGGHGTVYKGRLEGQDVAVKKSICTVVHPDTVRGKPEGVSSQMHAHPPRPAPSPDTLDDLAHSQCLNEITLLSKVHHRNLVRLLGYCLAGADSLLVYEFVPNGTLKDHLHESRHRPGIPSVKRVWLDWEKRLQIATETAEALHYLHFSVAPPVYHRDVKSSNILLDSDMSVKLSDFGLSKLGQQEGGGGRVSPFGAKGTPGYIDPEYSSGRKEATDKSDVYSFGVVLLELITGKKPVDNAHAPAFYDPNLASRSIPFIENEHTNKIIDPDLGAVNDVQMMASIKRTARVALACLAARGLNRPSMDEVLEELRGIKSCNRPPLQRFQLLGSQVEDGDRHPSPLSTMHRNA